MNNTEQIITYDGILIHGGIPTLPLIPEFVYLPTRCKLVELKSLAARLSQSEQLPERQQGALLLSLLAICDDIRSSGQILFKHFWELIVTFPIFLSANPLIDISGQIVTNLEYISEIITRDTVILIFQLVKSNTKLIELNGSYLGINDIRVWPIHGGFAVKCMQLGKVNMYCISINNKGDVKCGTTLLNYNMVDLNLTTSSDECLKIIENSSGNNNNNVLATASQQWTVQSYKHIERKSDPSLNPISALAPKPWNSGLLVKNLNDVDVIIPTPIACIKPQVIDKTSKKEIIPSIEKQKNTQNTSKFSKMFGRKDKIHHNEIYSRLNNKVDEDDHWLNTKSSSEEESP